MEGGGNDSYHWPMHVCHQLHFARCYRPCSGAEGVDASSDVGEPRQKGCETANTQREY